MKRTLDGYTGGIRLGGCVITNLRYANKVVELASADKEMQELVDRLNMAGSELVLMMGIDKTNRIRWKIM